ncbi:MAG: MFS transporter [Acidobacteriota bacterium]|nr:MFS transporter [Acidobacteriota bacterium]
MTRNRNLLLIYAAAFLRSLAIGMASVLLGIYLGRLGFNAQRIGAVIAVGLFGMALGTLFVSLSADRIGRRRVLVGLALLAAAGGAGVGLARGFWPILGFVLLGMLNSMGRDRGAAVALEQAIIPQHIPARLRTSSLSWYNLTLEAGHALGALAATLPAAWGRGVGLGWRASYQAAFGLYAFCFLASALLYVGLSRDVELESAGGPASPGMPARIPPESKRIVMRLAALFSLDSFGGGFLNDALLTYWFFRRFGVAEAVLGPLFFLAHALNMASYPVAAWLARRVGLVNTMVFTHIPSSLFLIAVPFAPSFVPAAGLYLARAALVEMDVPTRQSYVLAVVKPDERTFASGITTVARNVGWVSGPPLAGYLMQHAALAAPLWIGGGAKIAYDLLLYRAFRRHRPPEESPVADAQDAGAPLGRNSPRRP